MTRQTIVVDAMTYSIELGGTADPAAPTLVLLHGFTGSGADWGLHIPRFAAAGYRVIAPDLPGHGATATPTDPARYAIERTAADLLALMARLDVPPGRAWLLGYSMGGRIALGTALAAPHCFRGLILESASPGIADPTERARRVVSDNALADRIEQEGIPAFVAEWEALPLFATQRELAPPIRATQRAVRLANDAAGLAGSLRGVGTGKQPAYHDRLATLRVPTVVIAGELDTKFTAIARSLAESLPDARLAIVPGAGHTVHLEAPAAFDALVLDFCRQLLKN